MAEPGGYRNTACTWEFPEQEELPRIDSRAPAQMALRGRFRIRRSGEHPCAELLRGDRRGNQGRDGTRASIFHLIRNSSNGGSIVQPTDPRIPGFRANRTAEAESANQHGHLRRPDHRFAGRSPAKGATSSPTPSEAVSRGFDRRVSGHGSRAIRNFSNHLPRKIIASS